jgi:hypothetical protein
MMTCSSRCCPRPHCEIPSDNEGPARQPWRQAPAGLRTSRRWLPSGRGPCHRTPRTGPAPRARPGSGHATWSVRNRELLQPKPVAESNLCLCPLARIPAVTVACSVGLAEFRGRARRIDLAPLPSGEPAARHGSHDIELARRLARPPRGGGRSGCFGEGREQVERRPELAGRGCPGSPEALVVGQLSPVVGAGDPGA